MERTYTYTTKDRVENYLERKDEGRFTILEILNHHGDAPYAWLVEWFKTSNLIDSYPPSHDEQTAKDQANRLRQADEGVARPQLVRWQRYSKQDMVRRIWQDLSVAPTPNRCGPNFEVNKQSVRMFCLRAALHLGMPEWREYRDETLRHASKRDTVVINLLQPLGRLLAV